MDALEQDARELFGDPADEGTLAGQVEEAVLLGKHALMVLQLFVGAGMTITTSTRHLCGCGCGKLAVGFAGPGFIISIVSFPSGTSRRMEVNVLRSRVEVLKEEPAEFFAVLADAAFPTLKVV